MKKDEKQKPSTIQDFVNREYQYGFQTQIETGRTVKGLSEETIRFISKIKNEPEFMLEFRLNAFRQWQKMKEPHWANVQYPTIDYQGVIYYAEPKVAAKKPKNLEEVDPELRRTFDKLGISLMEQKRLAGVAVDAIFDSVSVATTFKEKLREAGVIFCSFSEAVQEHPELVKKYIGSVVPVTDNFFAALMPPFLRTALLSLCPKTYAARWNFPVIFASTPKIPGSLSAPSSFAKTMRT